VRSCPPRLAALFSRALTQPGFDVLAHLDLVVCGFFGAGCIVCLLSRHVRVSTGLMAVVAIACLVSRNTAHAIPLTWLATGYFTLWVAYVPRLPRIPYGVDLSYGTYLWAWPVQQTVVGLGVRQPWILIVIATPIVLAIALMSWLLVERPALQFKEFRWRRSAAVQAA
jgi:peptidoglycan/LPS O-acetylase OafA/YrhL